MIATRFLMRQLKAGRKWAVVQFLIVLVWGIGDPVIAESHSGNVLLTVISTTGGGNDTVLHRFDRTKLEEFRQHTLQTKTPWTEGVTEFSGPLLRDVIQKVGVRGKILKCKAINDYSIEIPIEDIERYDMILATHQNGKMLSIRNRGPLWVIYPWSEHQDLWRETYFGRSIWQLKTIEIVQ